jgi:hypothetical protein
MLALSVLGLIAVDTTSGASSLSLQSFAAFFNVIIGICLVATLLVFITGFILWATRFNTWPSYRDESIQVMEWGIAMLFMLIVLVALVRFVEEKSSLALTILSFLLLAGLAFLVFKVVSASKKATKEE